MGTNQYKEPIEEALGEMEKYSEERGEKVSVYDCILGPSRLTSRQLNRLRLVEKEKDRLEEGKKEAEDWLRLKNEHVRAQSRLWQWYLWKCLLNEEEFGKNIVSRFSLSLLWRNLC
jgi:structural maintenance of chromosome 4